MDSHIYRFLYVLILHPNRLAPVSFRCASIFRIQGLPGDLSHGLEAMVSETVVTHVQPDVMSTRWVPIPVVVKKHPEKLEKLVGFCWLVSTPWRFLSQEKLPC